MRRYGPSSSMSAASPVVMGPAAAWARAKEWGTWDLVMKWGLAALRAAWVRETASAVRARNHVKDTPSQRNRVLPVRHLHIHAVSLSQFSCEDLHLMWFAMDQKGPWFGIAKCPDPVQQSGLIGV